MEIEEIGGLLINDSYQGQRDVIPIYIQLEHVSYLKNKDIIVTGHLKYIEPPDYYDLLVTEHPRFVSFFDKYSSSIEYGGKNYQIELKPKDPQAGILLDLKKNQKFNGDDPQSLSLMMSVGRIYLMNLGSISSIKEVIQSY